MDDLNQGMPQDPTSAPQDGVEPVISAEPNTTSAPVEGVDYEQRIRAMQSEKDRIYAQNLALQNQMLQIQQSLMEKTQPQQQAQQNPYDPYTDVANYTRWEIWNAQQRMLPEIDARAEQKLMTMISQAAELNWIQQHPNVDVNTVKNFAKARGVSNLEDAYTLMNLQNNIQNVQRDTINSTFNQMKNTGAAPLRNTGSSPQIQPKYKFTEVLERVAKEPNYLDTLPKQVQEDFQKELIAYQRQGR